jgi:hypothetical protein
LKLKYDEPHEVLLVIYQLRRYSTGLKTGDVEINAADADVVVMTTEILRNMLYPSAGGDGGRSAEDWQGVFRTSCPTFIRRTESARLYQHSPRW